jgi:hypothetical protein
MRAAVRNVIGLAGFFACWFGFLEMLAAFGLSAPYLKSLERRIMARWQHTSKRNQLEVKNAEITRQTAGERTPFIEWVGDLRGIVLHPFINHIRVQHVPESELDYFGFRNPDSTVYFKRPEGKLVVLTGSSEAAGSFHEKSIAWQLEQMLNERSGEKWHVLNLAMDNYCLPYEISTYVYLAHHLKPDVVISHSGCGDLYFGLHVDPKLLKLGLIYYFQYEVWNLQAAGVKPFKGAGEHQDNHANHAHVVDAYLLNVRKFQNIVEGNHGRFIAGISPCEFGHPSARGYPPVLASLYKELHKKLAGTEIDYLDFAGVPFEFRDWCHTTESGAAMTANAYCEHILGRGKSQPVSRKASDNLP